MIITTTETVPGQDVAEIIGIARGSTVRARFVARDFIAALRIFFGGEVPEYTELMDEARDQALDRLAADARGSGADAVVNLRVMTTSITATTCEVVAYGTAVRLR